MASIEITYCVSCGAELSGKYCSACGEKSIDPKIDYSFFHFLEQTLEGFTHFDSKFFKSFWHLIAKPGSLTTNYVNGKRVQFMKPIQIFIITGVLFYVAFPAVSVFFMNATDMLKNGGKNTLITSIFGQNMSEIIQSKSLERQIPPQELINEIHREAAHRSKALLIAIIPFWALSTYLLFGKKYHYLLHHLVFTLHCFSFFIASNMLLFTIFKMLNNLISNDGLQLQLMFVIFLVYIIVAVRNFYQCQFPEALLKGGLIFLGFFLLLIEYRQLITAYTAYFL